jgi:hypothetical protein
MYVAEAAITVGKAVEISDSTDYPFGAAVLSATTAADHAICGIYEGQSESRGAATTVSGLAGHDAIAGETIFVTVHGPAVGLCHASTTDSTIAALDALDYSGTAGVARRLAAPAAGLIAPAVALEAQTVSGTGGTATDIFVRYM